MSFPMSQCQNVAAAKGDETAWKNLKEALIHNLRLGHFSTYPCDCDPKCVMTEEEAAALNKRLVEEVYEPLVKEREEALKKFDQDQKYIKALFDAAAEYEGKFKREVELMLDTIRGFPGRHGSPDGEKHDYSDFIMYCLLEMLVNCFAFSTSARGDKELFDKLVETVKRQEGRFNKDEEAT